MDVMPVFETWLVSKLVLGWGNQEGPYKKGGAVRKILMFNMNNPGDRSDYAVASSGHKYRRILWDYDQYLRGKLKYEDLDDKTREVLQSARDTLTGLCNEESLDIYSDG